MNSNHEPQPEIDDDQFIRDSLMRVPVPAGGKERALQRIAAELDRAAQVQLGSVVPQSTPAQGVSHDGDAPEKIDLAQAASTSQSSVAFVSRHRLKLALAVATSVLLGIGIFNRFMPMKTEDLVAACTRYVESQEASNWNGASLSDWTESLELLRATGVNRRPVRIAYQSNPNPPVGDSGRLWKLTFDDQSELFIVEIRNPPALTRTQQRIEKIQPDNQSWSIAMITEPDRIFLVFSKAKLERFITLSPLA